MKASPATKEKTTVFDVSEYLDSPEIIAEYLTACAQQGEQYFFAALGMSQIAQASGLERNGLYKAFSPDATNTQYKTVHRALQAMGLHIEVRANN